MVSCHLADSLREIIPDFYGPSQLIIIGCGEPVLITPYVSETGSAFPVFTGPSGETYEKIQVTRTAMKIKQPASYTQVSPFRAMELAIKRIWRYGLKAFTCGFRDHNHGKWMFRHGKRVYLRREEHADQMTAQKLLDILEYDVYRCQE